LKSDGTFAGGDLNASVFDRTVCRERIDVSYYFSAYGCQEIRQDIKEKLNSFAPIERVSPISLKKKVYHHSLSLHGKLKNRKSRQKPLWIIC